jgi:hypothetical protein
MGPELESRLAESNPNQYRRHLTRWRNVLTQPRADRMEQLGSSQPFHRQATRDRGSTSAKRARVPGRGPEGILSSQSRFALPGAVVVRAVVQKVG